MTLSASRVKMTLFVAIDQRRSVMHRRTIHGLALAALFAISGDMARADEQVVIVARYYPTPGREAELEARLLRSLKYVKQAEPNVSYRLHRSAKDPTVFLFYEVYPSQADRKSTRLNSSHSQISYAVFCLKKKKS